MKSYDLSIIIEASNDAEAMARAAEVAEIAGEKVSIKDLELDLGSFNEIGRYYPPKPKIIE